MKGKVSTKGFKRNSPDVDNDYNVIPSGRITMRGVNFPVFGVDNRGNSQMMYPNKDYYFPDASHVVEFPMRHFQEGGENNFDGGLSPEDARQALIEGHILGNPLTDLQRTHLAQIAGTDEDGNLLDEEGNVVDESQDNGEEEMRHGGQHNKHHGQTSKNIQSSRNELFLRNYNVYGPHGKHIYNPNAKQEGGEIMKKGGIHIAKNKVGTFTAAATKHGMGVQEFAHHVMANKEDYSPAMVKKANFAKNAASWSHQFGGDVDADMDANYDVDNDYMKKGGWIQGAIKHPGRCTPGSPNYDCPKGSPQWRLAQRFRHGDLHKKQMGGEGVVEGDYNNNFDNPFFQYGGGPSVNRYTEKKMNPQQWDEFNKQRGFTPMLKNVGEQTINKPSRGYQSYFDPNLGAPKLSPGSTQYTYAPGQLHEYGYQEPQKIKQDTRSGYIPFGQDTSGPKGYTKAGDTSGQKYQFVHGEYQPMDQRLEPVAATFQGGGEFLKALIKSAHRDVMKAGGEHKSSSPQGESQEDFLNNRNNTFKNYLSNNAMFALANEEANDIHGLHQQAMAKYGGCYECGGSKMNYGGAYNYGGNKYQVKGQVTEPTKFQQADSSEAYWNTLPGYDGGAQNQVDVGQEDRDKVVPRFNMNFTTERGVRSGQGNDTEGLALTSSMPVPGPYLTESENLMGAPAVYPKRSQFDLMSNDFQEASFQRGPQQKEKGPNWMQRNGTQLAEGIIGGMNFLTAGLNARNTRSNENLLKQRMSADNVFSVNQAGSANRGEYDVNSGMFKPNQMTPVQNRGNMRKGGEHDDGEYMSMKEIKKLQAQGFHVEFLD